jgi:hypothetical protein
MLRIQWVCRVQWVWEAASVQTRVLCVVSYRTPPTHAQLARAFVHYIDHKIKGSKNKTAKRCFCWLTCCLWCLEKCMKYITTNAYIMIAMTVRGVLVPCQCLASALSHEPTPSLHTP